MSKRESWNERDLSLTVITMHDLLNKSWLHLISADEVPGRQLVMIQIVGSVPPVGGLDFLSKFLVLVWASP